MYSLTLVCIVLISCSTILQVVHGVAPEQTDDRQNSVYSNNEFVANFFDDNDSSEKKPQENNEQEETAQEETTDFKQETTEDEEENHFNKMEEFETQESKEESTDFKQDSRDETTEEDEEDQNKMEELEQEDAIISEESIDDDSNQNEVPIDLNEEPIELDEEKLNDLSSEGFSQADQEFDKATSKVQFQALIKSQAQKCTCYCRQGGESSCAEIKKNRPNSYSGYYNIVNSKNKEVRVFCFMGRQCGIDGGWMRVVDLDMSRATARCPPALKEIVTRRGSTSVKHCAKPNKRSGGCSSVSICTRGIKYTHVCGKAIGYQYHNTDGGHAYSYRSKNINGPYMDGVSITRGSPRQHIWSYISSLSETRRADCPCSTRNGRPRLARFVGNNYYCESGFRNRWYKKWAIGDPLWDGKQCVGKYDRGCCTNKNMPWFYRNMRRARADKLEVRICGDEGTTAENVSIRELSLYVM